MSLGLWDVLLIAAVSVQATALAYLHHPKWKALLLSLPIPFTLAILAVGRPVDATNALGFVLLLVFTHCVRVLHQELRVPIIAAIVLSALLYGTLGWLLAGLLPPSDAAFWSAMAFILVLGIALLRFLPARREPGHRSPLPVWVKLPLIAAVVLLLVLLKSGLRGFTTAAPMVGVVAAYEMRHSLWTACRQIPLLMISMTPMLILCRLTSAELGIAGALGLGWIGTLCVLVPLTRAEWANEIT